MDLYLVFKDNAYRLLITPTEAEMKGAEVIATRLNVTNLYQGGFMLMQQANDLIYITAIHQKMFPEKMSVHKRLADIFEVDVPGVLMLSWQIARGMAEAELNRLLEEVPQQPAIL